MTQRVSKFAAKVQRNERVEVAATNEEGASVTARTISFDLIAQQVVKLICAAIEEAGPDEYHWLQDLYYDNGVLFAVTVSAGRLYRWSVVLDKDDNATIGSPAIVKVNFSSTTDQPNGRLSSVRQTADGRWIGASVLCTATVNKLGILDSRGLFDSFIERFKGDGREYINLLHLGGRVSRIGVMRHIFRDDKLLVGIYEFDQDDPVAVATARTLAADDAGYWGGSIEFKHLGDAPLVEVAAGITLPVTVDGEFLGYSFARSADCAAWHTCNLVFAQRGLPMTDKDRDVALELLGDETLVKLLAERLGEKNRTLDGAITYTVEDAGDKETRDKETGGVGDKVAPAEPVLLEYELDEAAVATLTEVLMARSVTPLVDERSAALRTHVDDLLTAFETRVQGGLDALTALETRVNGRLALLEKDDQARYQEYDQAKPAQPVIKLGVRPRMVGTATTKVAEVTESSFARKAREKRQKA